MKPTRSDLSGLRFFLKALSYNHYGQGAPTTILRNVIDEAEASQVGGDAIEELRVVANYIRESGVVLPAEDNLDPCDQSLAAVLQFVEDRIKQLVE